MKRKIRLWALWGFAITSFLGTLLHFLYDLTGGAVLIAPFSGVNESTWEHMKLLFWPMLLFSITQRFFFREEARFWCINLRGILLGLILIPTLFYTYNGVIGRSPDWVNIAIFFVSAAVAYIYEARALISQKTTCKRPARAIALLLAISVLFVVFTFKAPSLGIFADPLAQM